MTLPTAIKPVVSNKFLQGEARETRLAYVVETLSISELSIFPCAGSVSLVLLAGVDAAWSGDWSRIGAISKETELFLQSALTAAGVWHILMGLCAYIISSQNGRPPLPVTAKVMA